MFQIANVLTGFGGTETIDTPTLTVADNGDLTATFTIADSTAGSTNTVYTRRHNFSTAEAAVSQGSRSGDGTLSGVSLDAGLYYAYVVSTAGSQAIVSNIAHFEVLDADAPRFGERRLIAFEMSAQTRTITYKKFASSTVDYATMQKVPTFTDTEITKALVSLIRDQDVAMSNGRYQVGDWLVRLRHVDMPETPPSQYSRIVFDGITYQIYRHQRSPDMLVWDLFVRAI